MPVLAPGLALAAAVLLGGAADPSGEVTVALNGLRSAKGNVLVCMTANSRAFPDCRSDAGAFKARVAAAGATSVRFARVPQGRYAVAVLHDENANGKADRMIGMMPREGFGFSRDAPVRMGPPRFTDAVFSVANAGIVQSVRVRYIF